MNEKQQKPGRRFNRRYSAEDRVRLIREHAASGLTKKAFCKQRGINLGTSCGWRNLPAAKIRPQYLRKSMFRQIPQRLLRLCFQMGRVLEYVTKVGDGPSWFRHVFLNKDRAIRRFSITNVSVN